MMISLDGEFESASSMIEAIQAHRAELAAALDRDDQQALEAIAADPDAITDWMVAAFDESIAYIIVPSNNTKAA